MISGTPGLGISTTGLPWASTATAAAHRQARLPSTRYSAFMYVIGTSSRRFGLGAGLADLASTIPGLPAGGLCGSGTDAGTGRPVGEGLLGRWLVALEIPAQPDATRHIRRHG